MGGGERKESKSFLEGAEDNVYFKYKKFLIIGRQRKEMKKEK